MLRTLLALLLTSLLSLSSQAADKQIGILVWDGVLTSDITAPLEVFGHASHLSWFRDYNVSLIHIDSKPSVTTHENISLNVQHQLSEQPSLDVLIVPSAYDMGPILRRQDVIEYVRSSGRHASWVASNCSGAFVLAKAGLLDGKQATTWAGGEAELKRDFPAVKVQKNTNVVVDDGVITSNGSLVSYQAALMLLSKIASEAKAEEVADAIQYRRLSQQPFIR